MERTKVEAGLYEVTAEETYEVEKTDQGWVVRLGDVEIETTERLQDAEERAAEIDAELVSWAIPNNPSSVLHRSPDGSTTRCGTSIPDREDAEPRGICGRCF